LPRLPERYPLTIAYYRNLLGCPDDMEIEWCYSVAQPGMFKGELGFDLVKVFQSDPSLGPLRINDQFAEEAFTVYDHPKVLVFAKTDTYDSQKVSHILGAVDLTKVVHITPRRASSYPATLTLPEERWTEQRQGGTWGELFNTQSLQNRYPFIGALVWYVALFLLGLIVYPMLRLALPGLSDAGYPLARTAGLLLLSWLAWAAGSNRIPFTRLTIAACLALMILISLLLAYRQRTELRIAWREQRRYFLIVEGLFLAFFLFDLFIRLGNPDLWHPWKGGEKPMDFAYFNAVLKSTSFPPYDPWYAGGYLNYYYYGFVLVGTLVKLLGITPSIAYNLILPTLFAMIALAAFSLGWNLMGRDSEQKAGKSLQFWIGLAASLGMAVLGNLGTVRMIFQGYQRLVAPGGVTEGAGILTRWVWAIRGAAQAFSGTPLPYSLGDWYWIPSRAIPALGDVEPITEFPFFTVLYGDPHAHLYALPITLLVLAFALSVVLSRARWHGLLGMAAGFLFGALSIGALRPTNTWDFYPYLVLGCIALAYPILAYPRPNARRLPGMDKLPETSQRIIYALASVALLAFLSIFLYQPFMDWYGQGYTKVDIWGGTHTSLTAYLTHWGLFLFAIVSWIIWETRDWLASTPLSSLRKLEPHRLWIYTFIALILLIEMILIYSGASIAWFVLSLAAWAGVLLLRPGMPDNKRFVLFLIGTGLVLTLMVEAIVLRGDVGRMNTVFKFYLQVWSLFSISAAAALGWVMIALPRWSPRWRAAWQVAFILLVAGAAMYSLLGGMAKMKDRMTTTAPHTLDGMAFMQYAEYPDTWGVMDLSQDYRAIRWMQENVTGSPVIVEANLRELYRWGSRFSNYTGLPGVVGWEWHQQQQRALLPPSWVSDRIAEVDNFYTTTDLRQAADFLRKYDVRYIILGQQERGKYPGVGLDKFPAANGVLWREVYQDEDTVIYEVIDTQEVNS
jgi:YYY domain-containing protein